MIILHSSFIIALGWAVTAAPTGAWAGLIGGNVQVSQAGGSFPDVAYSTRSHKYLVVWGGGLVYGRLVSPTGQLLGTEIVVSEAQGLFPDIAYNAQNDEFLVVWDDQRAPPSPVWGQRIRASDGQPIGNDFQIGDSGSVRGAAVAWSPIGNMYLVVWRLASKTMGRWVSAAGVPQGAGFEISLDTSQSLYATVEFGGSNFLVTWDCDCPGAAIIRGRCVPPGGQPGSTIDVTTEGNETRSQITYDPGTTTLPARWLVQFTQPHPATGSDQYGAFVTAQCVGQTASFLIANEPAHEGDTYFGGDVAFLPSGGKYLSVFQWADTYAGSTVQELDRDGHKIGPQVSIGIGEDGGQVNAADLDNGRFLNVWHRGYSVIWAQLYEPIKPVTQLAGQAANHQISLTWTNPETADFVSTVIRYKTTGFPASPTDGLLAVEQPGAPGSIGSFTHTDVRGGVMVHYAAFAKDSSLHYASPAVLAISPRGAGDFDRDDDVDQEDFGRFQACLSGSGIAYMPGCEDADLDQDGDVDQGDFGVFQGCIAGADRSPGPDCGQ